MADWTADDLWRAVYGEVEVSPSPWELRMVEALVGSVALELAVEMIYAGLDAERGGNYMAVAAAPDDAPDMADATDLNPAEHFARREADRGDRGELLRLYAELDAAGKRDLLACAGLLRGAKVKPTVM